MPLGHLKANLPQPVPVDPIFQSYSEYKAGKYNKKMTFRDYLFYNLEVEKISYELEFYKQLLELINKKDKKEPAKK